MVDHDEEMTLEPPRKRHEVQEVIKKTEWKEARGRGEGALEAGARRRNGSAGDRNRCIWTLMMKATMDDGKSKNHRSHKVA